MDELNKKLAEWAGFEVKWFKSGGDFYATYPDGSKDTIPNCIESLNACFKWLVPQVLEIIVKKGYVPPIMKLFQLWYDELVSLTGDSSNIQRAALALCLAIEKLIDSEEKC